MIDRDAFNQVMHRVGWKTQDELARDVGMTGPKLSSVMHARTKLTFSQGIRLARSLQIGVMDLAKIMGVGQ